MDSSVPALPLEVDPLIAEAKQRARRRRAWIVAALVVVAAVAVMGSLRTSGSASTPARPAWLNDAMARGTLVSFNRRTSVAQFRISCGWYTRGRGLAAHTTTKVKPGLYRVPLRGGMINVQSGVDPKIPGSGHANEMKVWKWARGWPRFGEPRGWEAWLTVYGKSYVSDGPSWDICGGGFG